MPNWIDNADSYKCPICGYETGNPNRHNNQCSVCGFIADKDSNSKYDPEEMVVVMSVKERDEMVKNVKRFKKTLDDMRDVLADMKSFERTKELLKADKEGRCIVLPCKVGEKVYKVSKVNMESRLFYPPKYRYFIDKTTFTPLSLDYSEFGSWLFTDYEDALKALKEKENKNG